MGVFRREYKTKEGIKTAKNWSCEFFIDGERFCKTLEGSDKLTKREAERTCDALRESEKAIIRGTNKVTYDDAMEKYYQGYLDRIDKRQRGTHKKVQDRYVYIVERLNNRFSGKALDAITRVDIVEMIMSRRNEGAKDITIANDVDCLMAMYNHAETLGMCDYRDIPNFKSIKKLLRRSNPKQRYLTEAEFDKLMAHAGIMIKNIIVLAVETGMRKEEYLSLLWKDVDMIAGRIHVKDTKNGKDRNIPISQTGKELLQGLLHRNNKIKSAYVISKTNGTRYGDFKKGFAIACAGAKLKDVCIHDLRRTFGSWRLQGIRGKKLSLKEVSMLLGHTTTRMTERSYAFLDEMNITL